MKVLLVEDDEENVQMIGESLPSMYPSIEITTADNREEAIGLVTSQFFDLVILDLRIPPRKNEAPSEEHGLAVNAVIGSESPGTMVVFYTAFATIDLATRLVRGFESERVFGGAKWPMRDLVRKERAREFFEGQLGQICAEIQLLDSVEIDEGLQGLGLSEAERRIVRVAAKRRGCDKVTLGSLSGGLSSSRIATFRGTASGISKLVAVAKIGSIPSIEREARAYHTHIAPLLEIGAFPHLVDTLTVGAGNTGTMMYAVAEDSTTLYECFRAQPDKVLNGLDRLRACQEPWTSSAVSQRLAISDLRKSFIDDARLDAVAPGIREHFATAERETIEVRMCPQHRDLHGANVMIQPNGRPILIDFADADLGPSGLDPVTLEMSFLIHPAGAAITKGWPSAEIAAIWPDINAYVASANSPELQALLSYCRKWATEAARGYNPVLAIAYCLSLKGLKYPDVNRPILLAVAKACMQRLGFM